MTAHTIQATTQGEACRMSKGDKVVDSLPQRMREAAKVLREADRRCHGRIEGWTPLDLEGTAEAWDAEDRATAEREAMVEELARDARIAPDCARMAIESGWKKVTDE